MQYDTIAMFVGVIGISKSFRATVSFCQFANLIYIYAANTSVYELTSFIVFFMNDFIRFTVGKVFNKSGALYNCWKGSFKK